MKEVDWDKPIQTVDGKAARYLGERETADRYTHIVAIEQSPREELISCRSDNGRGGTTGAIINVPEEYWVNVYKGSSQIFPRNNGLHVGIQIYSSEEEAVKAIPYLANHIKAVKIDL